MIIKAEIETGFDSANFEPWKNDLEALRSPFNRLLDHGSTDKIRRGFRFNGYSLNASVLLCHFGKLDAMI